MVSQGCRYKDFANDPSPRKYPLRVARSTQNQFVSYSDLADWITMS